jgi:hypothetical protein
MALTLDLNRPSTISDDETRLAKVPLRVVDQEKIPSRRYYDQAFFDLEREKLWPHVWQMACRLEEVAEVGDYVEYKILDRSVIVVRTKTGVKAFHNACRHRGLTLVEGSGNCKTKKYQSAISKPSTFFLKVLIEKFFCSGPEILHIIFFIFGQ